jgi:hypothetical protein
VIDGVNYSRRDKTLPPETLRSPEELTRRQGGGTSIESETKIIEEDAFSGKTLPEAHDLAATVLFRLPFRWFPIDRIMIR